MLVTTSKEKFYSLREFIDYIKNDERFENALRSFVLEFKKGLKEGLDLIGRIELNAKNIDELKQEMREKRISFINLSTDEMIYYAEFICDKANVVCEVKVDDEGDLIYKEVYLDFNPKVFKNVAFLYFLERGNKPELTEEEWQKFKERYESEELPEELWKRINDFEYEIKEKVKEKEKVL